MTGELVQGPAYRVETPRLRLRCWRPSDAPLLHDAIEQSLAHLRPWMAWATLEPLSREGRVERLRRFRGDFDLGEDYAYGVFSRDESRVLGGTGLHRRERDREQREIGYWIHRDHCGQGYATELSAALVRVAFEVEGLPQVQIRSDPDNAASLRIPRKLGFGEPVLEPQSFEMGDGTLRDTLVFTLRVGDFERSPARNLQIAAFDVLDEQIL